MREYQAFFFFFSFFTFIIILSLDISEAIEHFLARKLVISGERKKLCWSNKMSRLPGIPNES